MQTETQKGAQQGIGEMVFNQAVTGSGTRVAIPLPPHPGVAGWLLTVVNWPTATPPPAGGAAFAFVDVNSSDQADLTNALQNGAGAPAGGVPLSPGQPMTDVLRADRDIVYVDVRGVNAALGGDAVVTVTIQVHALYATPKCPEQITPDCNKPPEKRRC